MVTKRRNSFIRTMGRNFLYDSLVPKVPVVILEKLIHFFTRKKCHNFLYFNTHSVCFYFSISLTEEIEIRSKFPHRDDWNRRSKLREKWYERKKNYRIKLPPLSSPGCYRVRVSSPQTFVSLIKRSRRKSILIISFPGGSFLSLNHAFFSSSLFLYRCFQKLLVSVGGNDSK